MTLVAHYDLKLYQICVKMTILNRDLKKEVYMFQPDGFKENN